jgi:hypothetical protein
MPDPERAYSLGADTGGGKSSSDFCAAVVTARDTGEQCATFQAHIEAPDFADVLYNLGTFYGGRETQAFLVLEVNAHGLAVLEKLKLLGYYNLYMRQAWDAVERKMALLLGWQTNVRSRPILVNRGRIAFADPTVAIYDDELLKEASTFVFTDAGREDHLEGAHDDILFGWMLSHEGRNLQIENNPKEKVSPQGSKFTEDETSKWVWNRVREDQERQVAIQGGSRGVYEPEEDDDGGWHVE